MKKILAGLILVSGAASFAADKKEQRLPAAAASADVKKGDYLCAGSDTRGNSFEKSEHYIGYMNALCDRAKPFQIISETSGSRITYQFCCVRK